MKCIIYLMSVLFSSTLYAQNLAPDIANYDISVSLDTKDKVLLGSERLTWTNTSPVAINELQFHLYLNAFRDKKSTFIKESRGIFYGNVFNEKDFGYTYITSLKSNRGEELLGKMKYIQPDDKNENDRTVISVPLKMPLGSGESIQIELSFKAKLPKILARTGYGENNYYLIGQWFPKIGVFEENKNGVWEWNCHQFHANSEFYADFGKYRVSITLPEYLTVGATGKKTNSIRLKGGLKTEIFEVDDVHDFAWTASPSFMLYEKKWKNVKMLALMQPEHAGQHKRYFDAAEKALAYFEKTLGKYPYQTLTLVDPPMESSSSAGMEYPTFVTCGSYWGVGKWFNYAEIVTVHEFGHQYFQGILASNEFEQSFMDEGFNQYMEGRIMDENYGKGSIFNLFGYKMGDKETARFSFVSMEYPDLSKINKPSWEYPRGVYGELTYSKTATILNTFEHIIGRAQMDRVLKAYYERWKFKHPKLKDFEDLANQTLGKNYDWFFEQAFEKSYSCDYSVDTLINNESESSFTLKRKGGFILPQEVLVSFEDGSTEIFIWDAKTLAKEFSYQKNIVSVQIDPQKKNLLDLNLLNNSLSVTAPKLFLAKYSAKVFFWMQHFMTGFFYWIG